MEEEKKVTGKDDWWKQDKVDAVGWGVAFIWGALVLLAEVSGLTTDYSWWDGWGVFFTGAGVITLIGTLVRLQIPAYRSEWVGGLIWGTILLAVGLGTWVNVGWLWVAALAAAGVIILKEAFARNG